MRDEFKTHGSGSVFPRQTPMPDEATEVIADMLIACAGSDGAHPAYSEVQLSRKQRRIAHAEEHFCTMSAAQNASPSQESDREAACAGLSAEERTVWEMYSAGYRISEIARLLNMPRQIVMRRLRSIRRHIHKSEDPFQGLRQVYYREVHRCVYRRPSHCADQPCRRLGYCKFPPSQSRLHLGSPAT